MSFNVPYSSSPPPSTPDRRPKNGFYDSDHPSTTPAGPPPPSSAPSFTPQGQPPSLFLGSSTTDVQNPIKPLSFGNTIFSDKSSAFASTMRSQAEPKRSGLSFEYNPSSQESFRAPSIGSEEESEEYEEDQDGQHFDNVYDGRDEESVTEDDVSRQDDDYMEYKENDSQSDYDQRRGSNMMLSHRALMRTTENDTMNIKTSFSQSVQDGPKSVFGVIARDVYTRMSTPMIEESDDLVLKTEFLVSQLFEEGVDKETKLQNALTVIPSELTKLWRDYYKQTSIPALAEYTATIGPGPNDSNFAKANFLAGLALQIHHPQLLPSAYGHKPKSLPLAMLEWLDEQHNPYPRQIDSLSVYKPSPSNSPLFWDTIYNCLIRGKVIAVISVLKEAGWEHARNVSGDPMDHSSEEGLSGIALRNVQKVMTDVIQLLSQCPATQGEWDIQHSDWTIFRLKATQALKALRNFTEGDGHDHTNPDAGSYTRTAQKATSKVSWPIYQNLIILYNIIMGDQTAIIANSQDWCEATVGLLVWWDESSEDRRLAHARSRSIYRASARESDEEAYKKKLKRAFHASVSSSSDFDVNTTSEIEVGLASLYEGDNEALIGFLRGWSGPVSAAVAEVASMGGWLPRAEEKSLMAMGSLDQDDLDLLGFDTSPSKADGIKDKTLVTYARSLMKRRQLKSSRSSVITEGWEIAICILGRLDSAEFLEETITEFLGEFELNDPATVDKLWKLLIEIGMSCHAESIVEKYADGLAEGSHKYGQALWYYALAHKSEKVKDVLNLLISLSLIQSIAYPPESDMDDYLRRLLSSPKATLIQISQLDNNAAELLHRMLSGYATLRRFYDIRDEGVVSQTLTKVEGGLATRKYEAATALLAVISSSDDNIRGGLYDETREAVVSVDFLLGLLGEAMVFVNQSSYNITVAQIDILLRAIEDLQQVGARVYTACSEFFQTVVASGQGMKGSTPSSLLRKSTSNMSGSSNLSLGGSWMLASQLKDTMSSSGILVKGNTKRGWDWRTNISANSTGDELLRTLRYGLAKDLARAWMLEADNRL